MKFIVKLLQIIAVLGAALLLCFLLFFLFCSLFGVGQSGGIILLKIFAIGFLIFLWGVLLIVANKIL